MEEVELCATREAAESWAKKVGGTVQGKLISGYMFWTVVVEKE